MEFKKWGKAIETDVSNAAFGTLMYSLIWGALVLLLRWLGFDPYSLVESIAGAVVLGALSAWFMGFSSFNSCGIHLRRMHARRR